MSKTGAKVIYNAVEESADYKFHLGSYNALLIHHVMTGEGAAGYVSVSMTHESTGTYVAHHGEGTNIPAGDKTENYTCIVKGLMDWVNVQLNITAGAHTVIIQPLML